MADNIVLDAGWHHVMVQYQHGMSRTFIDGTSDGPYEFIQTADQETELDFCDIVDFDGEDDECWGSLWRITADGKLAALTCLNHLPTAIRRFQPARS